MVNLKILRRAIAVGVMFELLLVVAAHYRPWLQHNYFLMFGCMLIAGVAGLLYARDLARGFLRGRAGRRRDRGAVRRGGGGGGQSVRRPARSVDSLGRDGPDRDRRVGGLFGQLDALLKAFIRSLR